MNQNSEPKRIVIIGGMGPQASIHAHKRLQELLIENNKNAEIVHVSLVVEHFFNSKPALNLSERQKDLLRSIDADVGFIACNTAHLFFDKIEELTKFKLISFLDFERDPENSVMVCSPTSKIFKVFGKRVNHLNNQLDNLAGEVISLVNLGEKDLSVAKFNKLIKALPKNKEPILSCTELSMLAHELGIRTRCTLEESLKKIVEAV